jgi:hypothetical protein
MGSNIGKTTIRDGIKDFFSTLKRKDTTICCVGIRKN